MKKVNVVPQLEKPKKRGTSAAWCMALLTGLFALSTSAQAGVQLYSNPPLPQNTTYSVTVDNQAVRVNDIDMKDGYDNPFKRPVCDFGFDGTVTVKVTPTFNYSSYRIMPTPYGIASSRSGNTITFSLSDQNKGKVVVQFDNDQYKSLIILGDPRNYGAPTGSRIIGPGEHFGDVWVNANETVWIAPGAVIRGNLTVGGSNSRVLGRGYIFGTLGVLNYLTNIEVSGVHFAGYAKWTLNVWDCTYVNINHIKTLFFNSESDGLSFNKTGYSSARHCFFMNGDDLFTPHGTEHRNNTYENIVCFKGGGNILGTSTNTGMGPNNLYKGIYVVNSNCCNLLGMGWGGGPYDLPEIRYEDVYVEDGATVQSFIFFGNITNTGNRTFTLKNVRIPQNSEIYVNTSGCTFNLENLKIGSQIITSKSQLNIKSEWSGNTWNFINSNGPNLITNPSFDAENYDTQTPSGWSEWSSLNGVGSGYSESYGGSKSGARHGTHWSNNAYNMYTYQTKTGLTNGLYTARVWAKRGSGQKSCHLEAKDYGGSARTASIPVNSNYQLVEIKDINVTNGKCTIGIWSDANAGGNWVYFDDVEFRKQ